MRAERRTYTWKTRRRCKFGDPTEACGEQIAIVDRDGEVLFSFGLEFDEAERVAHDLLRVVAEWRAEIAEWRAGLGAGNF
jgi:hypothetical protein